MRRIALVGSLRILIGLACPAIAAQAQPARTPLAERIALAFGDEAGGCIALPDSIVRSHPWLTILWPPADQAGGTYAQVIRARVGARRGNCWAVDSGYAIDGAQLKVHTPYLVVLGKTGQARPRRDRIEIDLTGDGKPESMRVCTSMEGLHFTVWAGVPLRSRRLAHIYAPLGYDVEPSCKPAEYDENPGTNR